jgi:pimeloyl-ACP methyl ester carboxylesterase
MSAVLQAEIPETKTGTYVRSKSLVLVNGLAEQPESWYRNVEAWRRHFDVHTPGLLVYDGDVLHRRIDAGEPIDVEFLVERLHSYLDLFVQNPPYHLLANSMGGKIVVEFARKYPELVDRVVLVCPSGLAESERLPIVEGVRSHDPRGLVASVFRDASHTDEDLLAYYQRQFGNRRWRTGLLRTIRGTMDHSVRGCIAEVSHPTLLIVGRDDQIVDPEQSIEAGRRLPNGRIVVLEDCGHAPQIEHAEVVNRLVASFLTSTKSMAE